MGKRRMVGVNKGLILFLVLLFLIFAMCGLFLVCVCFKSTIPCGVHVPNE